MHRTLRLIALVGLLALGLTLAAPVQAQETSATSLKKIGFGFGFNYHVGFDTRFTGAGNLFLLSFRLNEQFQIALMREEYGLTGSGQTAAMAPQSAEVNVSIVGLRLLRTVSEKLRIGLDIGNATLSSSVGQSSPTAAILVSLTTLKTTDPLFDAVLDIDLGYRFLNIRDANLFSNTAEMVKDLSGFFLGANFKILF